MGNKNGKDPTLIKGTFESRQSTRRSLTHQRETASQIHFEYIEYWLFTAFLPPLAEKMPGLADHPKDSAFYVRRDN